MIDVQQVHYGYNHSTVLTNLSLKESEPVITALWGRNGAGKTTLMSLLAGHQRPDREQFLLKEKNLITIYMLKNIYAIFKKIIRSAKTGQYVIY
ncbi:ATP-binding cassette domain-containing protein [Bacillus coahuilensis]|uniref:ATP-binding cassette domain-containing protein n=1 Tax=Bacillus coahuilensis TaxID=408580 RepID=UPI0001850B35|nr:ATP-binding cassette domain-containing protein [Bacillus coahuilensis]